MSHKVEGVEHFVKVGPYQCSVKYIDSEILWGFWMAEHGDDDEVDDYPSGMCNKVKDGYQILLRDDMAGPRKAVMFNHELLELINSQYDLNLSHQTICTLSEALAQFELDNKEVLKKLK